jgi:hypothetical protein
MTDLSPEARDLLETSRDAAELTRAERERIKRGVLVQVATLGAATATAGTAAAMSLASKITLVAVSAAVLGGGAVTLWAARERAATSPVVAQDSRSPRKAAAALPPPNLPQGEVTVASPSANPNSSEGGKKPSKRSSVTAAPTTGSAATAAIAPLDPELEVLRQAREDLRQGLAESAYRRLVDFDQSHGGSVLGQERQALSAIALCQWRPGPEAQALVAEFLRNTPESPLAERVRLACARAKAVTR